MLISALATLAIAATPAIGASTGWLDTSFGQNGTVDLRTGTDFRAIDAVGVVRGPRGVVVLSDAEWALGSGSDNQGYRLDALTWSGRSDTSFNGGKPIYSPYVTSGTPGAIVARPNGFWVVGVANDFPGIDSLRIHGYGWDGRNQVAWNEVFDVEYETRIANPRATVLANGSLRVCFTALHDAEGMAAGPYLFGLTPSGERDVTVGPNGLRQLNLGPATTCEDLATDASGRLLAVGNVAPETGPAVIGRFSDTGIPDAAFGKGGHQTLDWSGRAFRVDRLVRMGNGAIIAGESRDKTAGAPWIAFTAHFSRNGTVNTSYGYGGVYRYPGGAGGSILRSIDPVPVGRLVVGVASVSGEGAVDERLARIDPATGRLDSAFGRNGWVGVFHEAVDTTFDSRGRTLTVGSRVNISTSILVQVRFP
jgi:hypothetical protein